MYFYQLRNKKSNPNKNNRQVIENKTKLEI